MYIELFIDKVLAKIKPYINGIDEEKLQILRYGLYLIFGDILKLLIIVIISLFLGVLKYTMVAIVSFGLLRMFCGGVHGKNFYVCLISYTAIIFSIVYFSILLHRYLSPEVINYVSIFCIFSLLSYAPADHENRPIKSRKLRLIMKTISFLVSVGMIYIAFKLLNSEISAILVGSIIINSISILPVTYKISGNRNGRFYFEESELN